MVTPELKKYVTAQKLAGVSDSVIKHDLASTGWIQSDIASALSPIPITGNNEPIAPLLTPSTTLPQPAVPHSLTTKLLSISAVIGFILCLVFLSATFVSGNSIYKSPPAQPNGTNLLLGRDLDLSPNGNPYRVFLTLNYEILGTPLDSHTDLIDYTFTIKDSANQEITQGQGNLSHSERSSEEDDTTISLTSNNTLSTVISTFSVKNSGSYRLSIPIVINPDSTSAFQIKNLTYEIKEKVTVVSPLVFLAGFILLFIPLAIFIIKSSKRRALSNATSST